MNKSHDLTISTSQSRQIVDITDEIQGLVLANALTCTIFVAHTTCALTTADLDPGMDMNLLDALWELIPNCNIGTITTLRMCRPT